MRKMTVTSSGNDLLTVPTQKILWYLDDLQSERHNDHLKVIEMAWILVFLASVLYSLG
jgi:hypothetical protein